VPLDQNIFLPEFIVRITTSGGIAVRLHSVMEFKKTSAASPSASSISFFVQNVECTFGGLACGRDRRSRLQRAIGISAEKKAAFLRCHVAGDIIQMSRAGLIRIAISNDLNASR